MKLTMELKETQENNLLTSIEIMKRTTSNEEGLHHIDDNVIAIKRRMEEETTANQLEENINMLKSLF